MYDEERSIRWSDDDCTMQASHQEPQGATDNNRPDSSIDTVETKIVPALDRRWLLPLICREDRKTLFRMYQRLLLARECPREGKEASIQSSRQLAHKSCGRVHVLPIQPTPPCPDIPITSHHRSTPAHTQQLQPAMEGATVLPPFTEADHAEGARRRVSIQWVLIDGELY